MLIQYIAKQWCIVDFCGVGNFTLAFGYHLQIWMIRHLHLTYSQTFYSL